MEYHTVLSKPILSEKDYEEGDLEILKSKIDRYLDKFLNNELKEIDKYFEEEWIDQKSF
jgi:hypothetical protein